MATVTNLADYRAAHRPARARVTARMPLQAWIELERTWLRLWLYWWAPR